MKGSLIAAERKPLQALQKQRRDDAGYVKVTVVPMLDAGWPVETVAQTLGLDQATVCRYAGAFASLGLAQYLAHEQPGYWGRLSRAQLAHLCREVNTTPCTDARAVQAWLARTHRGAYSASGLTELSHRLGFTYKLMVRTELVELVVHGFEAGMFDAAFALEGLPFGAGQHGGKEIGGPAWPGFWWALCS